MEKTNFKLLRRLEFELVAVVAKERALLMLFVAFKARHRFIMPEVRIGL